MRRFPVQGVLLLLLIGFATPSAQADPVRVTVGQATAELAGGTFTFTGDGFSLTGGVPDGFASSVFACTPCSPENPMTLGLSSSAGGHFEDGFPGTFGGVDFPATFLFGQLTFTSADFSSTVLSPDNTTLTAPFTFSGELRDFATPGEGEIGGTPLFVAELTGSGTATAHFRGPISGLFTVSDVTYQFSAEAAPTPEPATLLLCGPAAAWLMMRRRSRRA